METPLHMNLYTWFVIAKRWKPPQKVSERINKTVVRHTMEHYSAIKTEHNTRAGNSLDAPQQHCAKGKEIDAKASRAVWLLFRGTSGSGTPTGTDSRPEKEAQGTNMPGAQGSLMGDKNIWNWKELVFAQYCERTKYHWTVHFKIVNCMTCEFCLNKRKCGQTIVYWFIHTNS